jgi:hypothetical protein
MGGSVATLLSSAAQVGLLLPAELQPLLSVGAFCQNASSPGIHLLVIHCQLLKIGYRSPQSHTVKAAFTKSTVH